MTNSEETITTNNGVNLHLLQSKKFKTINIVVKCKALLLRETITKRALLPFILQQGSQAYPNRTQLQEKLDELYGAVLSIDGAKKGDFHIISFRLEIANEKFINNETGIIVEGIQLLQDIIFNPKTKDGISFDEQTIAREKETLRQKIGSVIDDKMSYANMRLIDEMCEQETYRLHVHGYEEDINAVTPETLYQYYQTMLTEDEMDVYVLGDFDPSAMKEKVRTNLLIGKKSVSKTEEAKQDAQILKRQEPKVIIENQPIQQAKLHLGYRTNTTFRDEDYAALQVFNGIYGGFPSSKLFLNVREKNSLAYYAASRLESHKGLLIVYSGIAASDYEKAREIIELQMVAMKNGDFTEKELLEIKELIVNQLLETMDHPQGMIELLYQQVIANKKMAPEQLIENIKQVHKEDVVAVAKKINEDTIYLLTSEGGEKVE